MSSVGAVEGSGGVQSVGRAFEILEVIAAQGGELSLSEIAASVGLPAPSAHRLLRSNASSSARAIRKCFSADGAIACTSCATCSRRSSRIRASAG